MYADYDFYTTVFYGTVISSADFPRLSSRASDFLDYFTRNKAASAMDEGVLVAIKKACCAIAEQMQTDETNKAIVTKTQAAALSANSGEVKSESVGSWSASYTVSSDYMNQDAKEAQNAINAAYASIAARYLTNTGLLYRGGCC